MSRGDTRGPREFYTGKMNERDVLGAAPLTPEFRRAYQERANERGYLPYGASFDLVRRYTNQDPHQPAKPFASELRLAVADALGLETDEDLERVTFYTAVGTPADVYHGVDGWIEYQTPDGKRLIVTLDVTKNPNKDEWKADVIIPEVTDPSENENAFLAQVEKFGGMVASKLEEQMEELAA
ncbi:hypothetical protein HZA85_01205 [Candidatus Uhrbacteria bacterium]|nr:hypothetical protein [Candidatus Uhrbacteria bacterium]